MKRIKAAQVVLNPFWYKLEITSRRLKNGLPEVDYAYVSGTSLESVKTEYSKSLGIKYFLKVKVIDYNKIERELDLS